MENEMESETVVVGGVRLGTVRWLDDGTAVVHCDPIAVYKAACGADNDGLTAERIVSGPDAGAWFVYEAETVVVGGELPGTVRWLDDGTAVVHCHGHCDPIAVYEAACGADNDGLTAERIVSGPDAGAWLVG